jgi:hypothetical protein
VPGIAAIVPRTGELTDLGATPGRLSYNCQQLTRGRDGAGSDHRFHGGDTALEQALLGEAGAIERLERCRIIVRYGTGHDNIDVAAP